MKKKIKRIYAELLTHFGPQGWWPAQTPFEVVVGAVLTQNTSWQNVERAITHLRAAGCLTLRRIDRLKHRQLAALIRPAGYYNVKARRLKNVVTFIARRFSGSLKKMRASEPRGLRRALLAVNGVGCETADSILLYALDMPFFVVDAYTRRLAERYALAPKVISYEDLQAVFAGCLAPDAALFNEYHALIVRLSKDYCKKNNPRCAVCPLSGCARARAGRKKP